MHSSAASSSKSAAFMESDPLESADTSTNEGDVREQVDGDLCVVCLARASLRCEDCDDEFYCGAQHRDGHRYRHRLVCCKGLRRSDTVVCARFDAEVVQAGSVQEDAPLLSLPWEVLVLVSRHLGALDLVHLGQVCRGLRSLARHPDAWAHVVLHTTQRDEDSDGLPRTLPCIMDRRVTERRCMLGALRIAPALHTLLVDHQWPPVNLLRCTARVKVFQLRWPAFGISYEPEKLQRILQHYRGHLEVVKLNRLHDVKLLKFLDHLGLKELHVGRVLAKAYPASGKVVTELEAGEFVGGLVLARLLRACRPDLVAFEVPTTFLADRSDWMDYCDAPAWCELARCSALETIIMQTPQDLSFFNSFPMLRALVLWDAAEAGHGAVSDFFVSSPAVRRLDTLGLQLSYMGHRGLIQVAAEGCRALKHLLLFFDSDSVGVYAMNGNSPPDVPRDLAAILGHLVDLEKLQLTAGRVPSTVFTALAEGALTNLKTLVLQACAVTQKGRDALQTLKSSRPDLEVEEVALEPATERSTIRLALLDDESDEDRCSDSLCAAPSDCEEEDPILNDDDDEED